MQIDKLILSINLLGLRIKTEHKERILQRLNLRLAS